MPKVEVVFKGQIEVGLANPRNPKPGYRWVDGYSVVIDGIETQPWMTKREAHRLAKKIKEE
jgi:hypothetical protein